MAQSIKYFLCKIEDLGSTPEPLLNKNKKKIQAWWCGSVIAVAEKQRPVDAWGSLACQPSLFGETLSSKEIKVNSV